MKNGFAKMDKEARDYFSTPEDIKSFSRNFINEIHISGNDNKFFLKSH